MRLISRMTERHSDYTIRVWHLTRHFMIAHNRFKITTLFHRQLVITLVKQATLPCSFRAAGGPVNLLQVLLCFHGYSLRCFAVRATPATRSDDVPCFAVLSAQKLPSAWLELLPPRRTTLCLPSSSV